MSEGAGNAQIGVQWGCWPGSDFELLGSTEEGSLPGLQDPQLYQQILGLSEPWKVTGVNLRRQAREVEVVVECTEQVWACPACGQRMHSHEWEQRRWRRGWIQALLRA